MSKPDQPSEHSESASRNQAAGGSGQPDLTIRQLDGANEAGSEQAGGQSVFSSRSGIQDPLVKANPAELEPEEDASSLPDAQAPDVQPQRKRRKTGKLKKGNAKVLKSKRHLERAHQRQRNFLQERRQKKRLQVFYLRIRAMFKLCFALLWGVLLWEMVHSSLWFFNSPRFSLQDQTLIQASQLTPLVNEWVGKPLYAINTGQLARKIQRRFSLADRVVVRRQLFPASLTIQVVEKKPWAELYAPVVYDRVQAQTKLAAKAAESQAKQDSSALSARPQPVRKVALPYGLATETGFISLAPYRYRLNAYPTAEKILIAPQTPIKKDYMARLREIAWQARQIPGLHLETVDVRQLNQVILNYREIPVILGPLNAGASDRLARLAALLPKIREYRDVIEAVDLRWEEQVTFHKKPNARLAKPKVEQTQG